MRESGSRQINIEDLEKLVLNIWVESRKHFERCDCLICRAAHKDQDAIEFILDNELPSELWQ